MKAEALASQLIAIAVIAELIAKKIIGIYDPDGNTCGYLAIRDAEDGRVLFLVEVGVNPTAEYAADCCLHALEKGARIHATCSVSSFIGRDAHNLDEGLRKYGGGIRAGRYIITFSGLPEHADEMVCISLAQHFVWFEDTAGEIASIFEISGGAENGYKALKLLSAA